MALLSCRSPAPPPPSPTKTPSAAGGRSRHWRAALARPPGGQASAWTSSLPFPCSDPKDRQTRSRQLAPSFLRRDRRSGYSVPPLLSPTRDPVRLTAGEYDPRVDESQRVAK